MTIDIQVQRKKLEEKRAELQENIASQTEAYPTPVSTEEISEGPQEFEEIAVDSEETQTERSIRFNAEAQLADVEAALKRIEDGTYGRCIVDGEPIPDKRLEAIPWAPRCIKHEAEWEQQNLSREELYQTDTPF